MRAPGMGWFKMPLMLWGLYATAIIQVLATPVLAITLLLLVAERALAAVGIVKVADLLDWFPRRYEDRRHFDAYPAQAGGGAVCLRGMVIDSVLTQSAWGGLVTVTVDGPSATAAGSVHGSSEYPIVNMSESERTPG